MSDGSLTRQIIVASSSHLWLLRAVTVAAQVNSLVQEKRFQLALELAVSRSDGGCCCLVCAVFFYEGSFGFIHLPSMHWRTNR